MKKWRLMLAFLLLLTGCAAQKPVDAPVEPLVFCTPYGVPDKPAKTETVEPLIFYTPTGKEEKPAERCASCEEKGRGTSAFLPGWSKVEKDRIPSDLFTVKRKYSLITGVAEETLSDDNFQYALYVKSDGDMTFKDKGYIEELYEIPYNLYDYDAETLQGTKPPASIAAEDYGFMTNTKLINKFYGEHFADVAVKEAKDFIIAKYNRDYTDTDSTLTDAARWVRSTARSAEQTAFYDRKVQEAKQDELIVKAALMSNRSLVYQDAEGHIRVRGMLLLRYEHIARHKAMVEGIEQGQLYFMPVDVAFQLSGGYMDALDDIALAPMQRAHTKRRSRYSKVIREQNAAYNAGCSECSRK